MKLFSQRKGLTKVKTEFQVESMDDELRNRLWNMLDAYYWENAGLDYLGRAVGTMHLFSKKIWNSYFKIPVDTLSEYWSHNRVSIRKYFFLCPWYNVYDFIEFVANEYAEDEVNNNFIKACNVVLESELSGYRFVGKQITLITSEGEIAEIQEALETPSETVNTHLENALRLMSDRKSPDYRNSIKESISAVEALCRTVTGNSNATLGEALNTIEREGKIQLHGALKKSFSSLYGYASSAEGIRHSLLEEKTALSFEDAKFMLVSCSAFVNYLISKTSKADLKLGEAKT